MQAVACCACKLQGQKRHLFYSPETLRWRRKKRSCWMPSMHRMGVLNCLPRSCWPLTMAVVAATIWNFCKPLHQNGSWCRQDIETGFLTQQNKACNGFPKFRRRCASAPAAVPCGGSRCRRCLCSVSVTLHAGIGMQQGLDVGVVWGMKTGWPETCCQSVGCYKMPYVIPARRVHESV